ncbi:MAG: MlaD family protein [Terricaulis sp.]
METKANYVLIGVATLVGAAAFMLFAMWLANSDYRGGFNEYEVVFDDPVRGLTDGGEVRFNGIKVGEVRALRIDAENTRRVIARIRVSSVVPVKQDSEARLEPVGLTGVSLIQLTPGSEGASAARSEVFGQPPRIAGHGSQIDILFDQSEDIVMEASRALAAVQRLLTEENVTRVSGILDNLETISARLADRDSVISRSAETATALSSAAADVSTLARQTQQDLAELDLIMRDMRTAAAVANSETLPNIGAAAEEVRRAAVAIGRFANNLEENPSVLTPRSPRPILELPQ